MYTVGVRRHMMIAHSLQDPYFGPAAALHGATYVVDVEFCSEQLNAKAVVVDIGAASDGVDEVLKSLDFRNLDDDQRFAGKLTTTEFLCETYPRGTGAAICGGISRRVKSHPARIAHRVGELLGSGRLRPGGVSRADACHP